MPNLLTHLTIGDKNTTINSVHYIVGTGSTAGTWLGADSSITEYYDGLTIAYKVGIAGASTTTLNINSLGAKTVYRQASSKVTTHYPVGSVVLLVYTTNSSSVGSWQCTDYDSNTNTNVAFGQGYSTCSTAAATVAKTVALTNYALTTGGILAIKFTYDVPASATLNVNSKGAKAIRYRGAAITADIIKAGDTATFIYDGTYYHLISIDKKLGSLAYEDLDENGRIPSTLLPGYVDDAIEGYYYSSKFYKESAHTTEITGESGKIYVDLSTNKTYRWSGSAFVEISASLALGETSSTAYRGDRGKTAYDHSQAAHAPSNAEKNQNAFSNIIVGSTTIAADSATDTFTLVAGSNITLTPDATNDKITIAATDTKVTSVDNHYIPSANSGSELTASLSGTAGSYAKDTEYTVLTGVKAQRDAKGHVTGLTYTAQKVKDTNTNTDAIYSGIGICGGSASVAEKVVTLPKFALTTNANILIKVSNTNTATSGVKLNVNSTGAKSIKINGSD